MQIHEIARRNINEGPLKGVATAPPAAPAAPKAGFARNAAEYFASQILDKAGVPAAQQVDKTGKGWHTGGHMAASQNKGNASIARAENEIATGIAKNWAYDSIVNDVKDETLDAKNIAQAAAKLNTEKLQLNTDNIVKQVQTMAPEYRRIQDLGRKSTTPTPTPTAQPANTAATPTAQPANTAATPAATPASTMPSATQAPPPAAAPTGFNYNNVMKMPGMSQPAKTVAPAAKAPTPAAAPAGFNYNDVMKMPGMKPVVKKPEKAIAESLTWSKNFDPSEQLYRRMKQGQSK